MGAVTDAIRTKIVAAFAPTVLEITDDSDKHRGHAGHREGGESHFTVLIVSNAFVGYSRLERQRMVNAALRDELAGPVHAFSVKAVAPTD